MDHSQQSCQALDEALRLAVLGATPHGVARVVLVYHQLMYLTVQTFLPCRACMHCGALSEEVRRNAAKLEEECRYYTAQRALFGKQQLHQLITDSIRLIDLSSLCASCREAFQQQLATAFGEYVVAQHV